MASNKEESAIEPAIILTVKNQRRHINELEREIERLKNENAVLQNDDIRQAAKLATLRADVDRTMAAAVSKFATLDNDLREAAMWRIIIQQSTD